MTTVIITKVYKVTVRVKDTYTLLCEKFFFDVNKAVEFSEETEKGNENIETLVTTKICEDSIIYTEEDK